MFSYWSVQSLLLPLFDVLEIEFFVPWSISNESIFVSEGHLLIGKVCSLEA